tara:strand:+ start:660 stop:1286 length:627 start_codon:yes stop_codon:yes gene_type:complete
MPSYITSSQHNNPKVAGFIKQYFTPHAESCITPLKKDWGFRPSAFSLVGKGPSCKNDPLTYIELENSTYRSFDKSTETMTEKPYSMMGKHNYVTVGETNKYEKKEEGTPMEIRPLVTPNVFKKENMISYNVSGMSEAKILPPKKLKNNIKVNSNVAMAGMQERNKLNMEQNPSMAPKVGDCKQTKFGCCNDGVTAKEDDSGSNCPKLS